MKGSQVCRAQYVEQSACTFRPFTFYPPLFVPLNILADVGRTHKRHEKNADVAICMQYGFRNVST
jgi:hypothetical protein